MKEIYISGPGHNWDIQSHLSGWKHWKSYLVIWSFGQILQRQVSNSWRGILRPPAESCHVCKIHKQVVRLNFFIALLTIICVSVIQTAQQSQFIVLSPKELHVSIMICKLSLLCTKFLIIWAFWISPGHFGEMRLYFIAKCKNTLFVNWPFVMLQFIFFLATIP